MLLKAVKAPRYYCYCYAAAGVAAPVAASMPRRDAGCLFYTLKAVTHNITHDYRSPHQTHGHDTYAVTDVTTMSALMPPFRHTPLRHYAKATRYAIRQPYGDEITG